MHSYSRKDSLILLAHIPCAIAVLTVSIFLHGWLIELYRIEIGVFAVFTFVAAFRLGRVAQDRGAMLLADLVITWALIQSFAIGAYMGFGSGLSGGTFLTVWSPSFIAILACTDFYLIYCEAVDQATEAESARRVFRIAGQVAHDIRSPLAALRALVANLQVSPDEKELASLAIERIDGIAKDVLSEYRLSGAKPTLLCPVIPVVESALREKVLECPNGPSISLTHDLSKGYLARFDPKQFMRVISNLLNNAIEATNANNGQIEIQLQDQNGFFRMLVSDRGRGIGVETLTAIREGGTTVGNVNGHGLGLSHAISFVRAWGGTLEIESKPGKGTNVIVKLPNS